jgi:signal transduction histidine kinase/ligand-binding sensor domain-containing protein
MTHRSTLTAARTLLAAVMLSGFAARASSQARFEPALTTYGKAEGMVNPIVVKLLQDGQGFLWIGTHDGLLRFDGRSFKPYRTRLEDPTSLGDDYVTALAEADSGRIWVGTERGGLQLLDPFTERIWRFPLDSLGPSPAANGTVAPPGAPKRFVSGILRFPSGVLLLLTDAGLVRFDPLSAAATILVSGVEDGPSRPRAKSFCAAADGRALVTFSDGTLALVDDTGGSSALPLSLPDSIAALEPTEGGYLAGTFDVVVLELSLDLSSIRELFRAPPVEALRVLHDVLAMPDGRIWLATGVGAYVADPTTGSVQRVGSGEGAQALPDQQVADVLLDHTGVVWLGTWNGLASLHPLTLRGGMSRFYSGPDLPGSGVISVADAGQGRLWVGTLGGGLVLLNRRGRALAGPGASQPSLSALSGAEVFGLARAGADTLWIAAYSKGLWLFDGVGSVHQVPVLDASGQEATATAYSVFIDHAREVWAGSWPLGLLRLDRATGVFRPYLGADPAKWDLGSDYVWPIDEDSQGRLWVGANGGGVSVIGRDRASATLYRAGPGSLSDDRVLRVFVDSRDIVWVGTEGGGLNRFDPATGTWTTWTTQDGLPHDNAEGIEEDADGRLWISTSDGLARFDPGTGEFLTFKEPAGLAGSRFYANAYRDSDGILYFGGPAGLSVVDPAAITAGGTPPQVALTAFRIQGREASLARALRTDLLDLEPNENFFAFEFAAMDFSDVSQNRYRYRLEGLDADWADAGTEPVANYTSVPPGRYTFRVAARNSAGIWNESALALPIRVQAPFYRTLWFQSLVAVAVLSLIVGFYTYRLRQLEARQRLRLEIAGKLHDDIGANLSTIALKAEMVRGAQGLDDRRSAQLADVGRLARDTATKVRETVWVVNTKYDTLAGLVGKLHDTADTLLAGVLPYGFTGPEDVPDRKISMETRQNVHLLFKETLNNVVKHASASRVDVTVALTGGNVLSFRVVDDGVGFDPSHAREGNGQRLMRQRTEDLGGTLQVTSAPGAGTTVAFTARLR